MSWQPFLSFPRRRVAAGGSTGTFIDPTGLTKIGTLTGAGGLAALFDGTTNQSNASGANAGGSAQSSAYAGMTLTSAKTVSKAEVWSTNNLGFLGARTDWTLTLYGKAGTAPSSSTDGTSLGSTVSGGTDPNNTMQTVTSSDTTTTWDHLWIRISTGSNDDIQAAEIKFYD